MKMLVVFHARRNGWKDLMMGRWEKQVFTGSSQRMKIFLVLLLGKIPEYFILSQYRKLVE
ncbi:MAG: hypothetical protein F6K40_19395 [Okeania sp. SIO3I5]|uniref:hypothetical protein n=1 Tax=Okeania sp. SIO3I5 TaxID=2607805 RepID=UPI0013B5E163|nr:hypothetical protein [Okeania sp. SIO3I5]NEQ38310.1 hypothetical protein [Okeania sp. SIO3I5]